MVERSHAPATCLYLSHPCPPFINPARQTVSLVLWLANSALQMTSGCNWMSSVSNILGYLQWSLIFTLLFLIVCGAHDICCYRPTRRELAKGVKQDPHVLVMDSPLKTHAPKILLWLVGQLVLSFLFWQIFRRLDAGKKGDWHLTCLFYSERCKMVHGSLAAFILMVRDFRRERGGVSFIAKG